MPRKERPRKGDVQGFLDPNHWIERISDPNYRPALLDALAEIRGEPAEAITEVYVALLLDVFGPWCKENIDRFKPYALPTPARCGRSLANEKRFSTIVIDEIPASYLPFRRLIKRYSLPLVLAALILYEIDSPDGSLITVLKAHTQLLKARMPQINSGIAIDVAKVLLKKLEPTLRNGRRLAANRRLGGQKAAEQRREGNRERNRRICREAKQLTSTYAPHEIAGILAHRFELTARQIRTILKKCKKEELG